MGSRIRAAVGAALVGLGVSFIARRRARQAQAVQAVAAGVPPIYVRGCGAEEAGPYDAPILVHYQTLELTLAPAEEEGEPRIVILNGPFHVHKIYGNTDGTSEVEIWFGPYRKDAPTAYFVGAYHVTGTPREIRELIEESLQAGVGGRSLSDVDYPGSAGPRGLDLAMLRTMVNAMFDVLERGTGPIVEEWARGAPAPEAPWDEEPEREAEPEPEGEPEEPEEA